MNENGNTSAVDWANMPEWITVDEAADLSGYHPEYIRFLARKGKIGAEKKGRDWWISPERFRAYLARVEALGAKKHAGIPQDEEQG